MVKAVFAKAGYDLTVDFYPWMRAVKLDTDQKSKYAGYFLEHYSKDLEKDFIFSKPLGSGPLGFAELISKPISWNGIDDLKTFKVGMVKDYVNTEAFDTMVAQGSLKVQEGLFDEQNLKKLAGGWILMAVIDQHVLMIYSKRLRPYRLRSNLMPKYWKTKSCISVFVVLARIRG